MQTAQLSLSSPAEKLMLFPWPLFIGRAPGCTRAQQVCKIDAANKRWLREKIAHEADRAGVLAPSCVPRNTLLGAELRVGDPAPWRPGGNSGKRKTLAKDAHNRRSPWRHTTPPTINTDSLGSGTTVIRAAARWAQCT
eukprot:scaffold93678_cov62-Phaeocystis_antarctica.AAC.1